MYKVFDYILFVSEIFFLCIQVWRANQISILTLTRTNLNISEKDGVGQKRTQKMGQTDNRISFVGLSEFYVHCHYFFQSSLLNG